jgi:radical SAM superfamily enzyme YgiQ (UPF0313 family)
MNIFFLNTSGDYPNQFPPLGLLYLAATCRSNGHTVFLYDLGAGNADFEECMREFDASAAGLVCLSLYTTQITQSLKLINQVRERAPKVKIAVGGPHVSALPTHSLSTCAAIDYEAIGEGENTLIELIKAIESGSEPESVNGLCYRAPDSSIRRNAPRERMTDLDAVPFPAVDLIARFKYSYDKFAGGRKVGVAVSSRGCPYNCTFCNKAVFGNRYTRRSPANMIAELRMQRDVLGIDEVYFVDDLFVTDESWLDRFMTAYRESGLGLPWKCLGRVDQVDGSMYRRMKEAGCFLVQFGVESGDEQIIRSIKKGIKLNAVREAVAQCRSAGINAATYFIIGHPGETAETALRTIRFACELNADICHFFVLVPFPGTANYQLLPQELRENWDRIRYYHKGQHPISMCALDPETLYQLEKQARYEFYGRIGYFLTNPLALRRPVKLSFIKASAFAAYFVVRMALWLTGRRVVTRLRRMARSA